MVMLALSVSFMCHNPCCAVCLYFSFSLSLSLSLFVYPSLCRHTGLVVKASALTVGDMGLIPAFIVNLFTWSNHTNDLEIR